MNQLHTVIRHSLSAAQAALDALDASTSTDTVVETAPVTEAFVETAQVVVAADETPLVVDRSDLACKVYNFLNHERFSLRTMAELTNKFNLNRYDVEALFDKHFEDEELVFRTRHSDQAELIGLESRN